MYACWPSNQIFRVTEVVLTIAIRSGERIFRSMRDSSDSPGWVAGGWPAAEMYILVRRIRTLRFFGIVTAGETRLRPGCEVGAVVCAVAQRQVQAMTSERMSLSWHTGHPFRSKKLKEGMVSI